MADLGTAQKAGAEGRATGRGEPDWRRPVLLAVKRQSQAQNALMAGKMERQIQSLLASIKNWFHARKALGAAEKALFEERYGDAFEAVRTCLAFNPNYKPQRLAYIIANSFRYSAWDKSTSPQEVLALYALYDANGLIAYAEKYTGESSFCLGLAGALLNDLPPVANAQSIHWLANFLQHNHPLVVKMCKDSGCAADLTAWACAGDEAAVARFGYLLKAEASQQKIQAILAELLDSVVKLS